MSTSNEDLAVRMALLEERLGSLRQLNEKQFAVLDKHQKALDDLLALANKSAGALWVLMALAAGFGAVVSNLSSIIKFFSHTS